MAPPPSTPALEASAHLRIDLGDGEELLLSLSPHWIFILLDRPLVLASSLAVAAFAALVLEGPASALGFAAPVAWLVWQLVERASRTYVLTDRRVVMIAGVLRQAVVDVPITNVLQASVFRTIPERLLGLGTVTFATAGTGGQDIRWRVLDRPLDTLRVARDAIDRAEASA